MPLHLLCHDIADPRRLRRVSRLCERHAQRLQDSVYLADLSGEELARLQFAVSRLIDPRADRVRWIPVCEGDLHGSRGLGQCSGLRPAPSHWAV